MKNENEVHFFLSCTSHAAHRQVMFAQLCNTLPQHLITNQNSTKIQKQLCKFLVTGTGKEEVDLNIFNIVTKFIEKTKRFEF